MGWSRGGSRAGVDGRRVQPNAMVVLQMARWIQLARQRCAADFLDGPPLDPLNGRRVSRCRHAGLEHLVVVHPGMVAGGVAETKRVTCLFRGVGEESRWWVWGLAGSDTVVETEERVGWGERVCSC